MRTGTDVPSLIDDADFLAELDRMESGPERPAPSVSEPAPVRRAAAPKPAMPAINPPRRLRLEPPAKPAAPPRPAHIAEIGDRVRAPKLAHVTAPKAPVAAPMAATAPLAQPRRVPATIAALTVFLGLTVGAGSAALLFHDRVERIVVTWTK
jgi:hypothetical protein